MDKTPLFYFCIFLSVISFLLNCNLSYDNIPLKLTKDTHSVKPPFSAIYHGKNYHFPANSCDQPTCHGSDLKGGTTGGISCLSCHDDQWYVFENFSHNESRGGFLHNPANESTCATTNCHPNSSTNITGHNFRYSCDECHNVYGGGD